MLMVFSFILGHFSRMVMTFPGMVMGTGLESQHPGYRYSHQKY